MTSSVPLTSPPFAWPHGSLDKGKVVQCALSRVCGGCGTSLGRPIAFLGTTEEVDRNAFHAPPLHEACARALRETGIAGASVVLTAGFEYVRPTADALDRRPTFVPNSIIGPA
ncbi:MAG: hypothetical protein NTV23_02415 [Propionibacteriales bacterium]|nr:hypothetical protein [Propionibacteriales bacterium]